jgi:hypothetical protein
MRVLENFPLFFKDGLNIVTRMHNTMHVHCMVAGRMSIVLSTTLQCLYFISFTKGCYCNVQDYVLCCKYAGNVKNCSFVVMVLIRHYFQDTQSS